MEAITRSFAAALMCMGLAGCPLATIPEAPPPVYVQAEETVALAAITDEQLRKCEGINTPMPSNNIGALLADNIAISGVAETCIARQHKLVDYVAPLVQKARAKTGAEK